jgi:uncharacterized protein
MGASVFSLILLPTLQCNADCDYCFEDKSNDRLSLSGLRILIGKVLDHLVEKDIPRLEIHWQGGEVMAMPPSWFARAYDLIEEAAAVRGRRVTHGLQTNMLGYGPEWNGVIREMFDNRISTSLDYPNLYRHRPGRDTADYTRVWTERVQQARAADIEVGVIAVANAATLEVGAERFYHHFVTELGVHSFQVNTPFPGGAENSTKGQLSLGNDALARFYCDLAQVWLDLGYQHGVRVGPFDELLAWFRGDPAVLPCIWTDNCVNHLLCIDARGHVAQCDCWVTSYPDYRFGNLFEYDTLVELLASSRVLERFQRRPMALVVGDCIECDYLALCHGGCPVRTFSVHETLFDKDPNCTLYQALFRSMATAAARLARTTVVRVSEG